MTGGASVVGLSSVIGVTLQASAVERLLSVPTPVRAGGTFLVVLLVGSLLRWRYELFVDEARSTSMSHPLAATGYGIVTHLVIAFTAVYLTAKFAQVQVAGQTFAVVGLLVGVGLVGVAGALGFTVVGEALVDLGEQPTQWAGLVVGAAIAGGVALADPTVAAVGWFLVVSAGVGGAIHNWIHASVGPDI